MAQDHEPEMAWPGGEVTGWDDMNVWVYDFQSTATAQDHIWLLQSMTSIKLNMATV